MEHSMNSYNKKKLEKCDFCQMGHNPNCGDEISLEIKLNGDLIEDLAFMGHGCAISKFPPKSIYFLIYFSNIPYAFSKAQTNRSTSSFVLKSPKVSLIAPLASSFGTPIAVNTCLCLL